MKNTFLIAKREFLTQIKKKSFIILTLLAPLLIIAFGGIIALIFKANKTEYTFNVIDKSGLYNHQLKSDDEVKYIFVPTDTERALKSSLKELEEIDGLLIIPKLEDNDFQKMENETKLLVNKKIGFDTKNIISSDLEKVVRSEKIKVLGLNEEQIKDIDKGFSLKTENVVDEKDEDDDLAFGVKSGMSMMLMYVVFMFIIIYGVRVMRSVLEEKNNRVVEIIISSVKPFELMMGKIIGVTGVALTQFVIWIMMSVSSAFLLSSGVGIATGLPTNLPEKTETMTETFDPTTLITEVSQMLLDMNFPLIIVVFIIFFLLGYIFYSSIYAAIGSAVDNETETQQFTLFAILPLSIGLYGSFSIMNNPDGPVAFWMSIIPFTSPVAMVARIPFGVPIWQILLSITLLTMMTLVMIFIASKIYRVGILMYGNKATLKEIWKWMKG